MAKHKKSKVKVVQQVTAADNVVTAEDTSIGATENTAPSATVPSESKNVIGSTTPLPVQRSQSRELPQATDVNKKVSIKRPKKAQSDHIRNWQDASEALLRKRPMFGYKSKDVESLLSEASDIMFELSKSDTSNDTDNTANSKVLDNEATSESLRELNRIRKSDKHKAEEIEVLTAQARTLEHRLEKTQGALSVAKETAKSLEIENKALKLLQDNQAKQATKASAKSNKISDLADALVEQLKKDLTSALNKIKDQEIAFATIEKELEAAKSEAKTASEKSYSEIGEVMMHAKRDSEKCIADAQAKAQAILNAANHSANEIKDDADLYYKDRVGIAERTALETLEDARKATTELFTEIDKARNDLIVGHNTIADRARENQNKMLDAMVAQRDLLVHQVGLATSDALTDIINTTSQRLKSADKLMIDRKNTVITNIDKAIITLPKQTALARPVDGTSN